MLQLVKNTIKDKIKYYSEIHKDKNIENLFDHISETEMRELELLRNTQLLVQTITNTHTVEVSTNNKIFSNLLSSKNDANNTFTSNSIEKSVSVFEKTNIFILHY